MSTRFYTPEEAVEVLRMAALDTVDRIVDTIYTEQAPRDAASCTVEGVMQLLHAAEKALREEQE